MKLSVLSQNSIKSRVFWEIKLFIRNLVDHRPIHVHFDRKYENPYLKVKKNYRLQVFFHYKLVDYRPIHVHF